METKQLEDEIREIHQKLDFLTDQFRQSQKSQNELRELKDDMTIIGKDMFNAAVEELQDVAPYFDTSDLVHLLKKLLRNTRNINELLEHFESIQDLFYDIKPLGKQVFDELLDTLNKLDKKGYFEFFAEGAKILDTVVTSFDVNDIRLLRENITTILLTVKSMTQPEMLSSVINAMGFFQKMDIEIHDDISLWKLWRKANTPEVKKGLAFMLEFVKNMAQNGKHLNPTQTLKKEN